MLAYGSTMFQLTPKPSAANSCWKIAKLRASDVGEYLFNYEDTTPAPIGSS
jgi:hypothetical protein